MNSTLRTVLIVLAVIVAAAALFFAGSAFGRPAVFLGAGGMPGYRPYQDYSAGPGPMRGGSGPGMMQNWRVGGMGPGMMGSWNGGYGGGPGMMGGYAWSGSQVANPTPLTVEEARQAASDYIDRLHLGGLELGEVDDLRQ